MAGAPLTTSNPYAQGIFNAVKDTLGLFQDYNKINDVKADGLGGDAGTGEYDSAMTEDAIRTLVKQWKSTYSLYYNGEIETAQKLSFDYWVGKHKMDTMEAITGQDVVDNLIFEAVETFLPIATRSNPEPVVLSDDSPQGLELANNVKDALVYEAGRQKLRMKLKKGARHWILSELGVWKVGYDPVIDQIVTTVPNPKHMILDKDGWVDEQGFFTGEYIGEKRKVSVDRLIEMFPKKEEEIRIAAKGKPGVKLDIIEWWYKRKDVFYTLEMTDVVLGKYKNPNWNYDGTITDINPNTGAETQREVKGRNHFDEMHDPYVFLSVFSVGDRPHDNTGLIVQNIPMQDMVNKRFRQIDKNVDSQNNGALASGDSFTKEQAAEAASFLRKGGTVWVPNGDVNSAWKRDAAPNLASDVYNQLVDSRNELRNIFGTSGSTPEGLDNQDTVRGKILVSQMDSSRIGGGVTEYIEQVAETIYQWWVQLMFVYYDEPHYITAMGLMGAQRTIEIRNTDLLLPLRIAVKEGSLIPKDPLTQRNEAMDLWSANAIGLPELLSKLDFPDPMESAKQTLLWRLVAQGALPPQMLFPDFPTAPMAPGMVPGAEMGGPSVQDMNPVDNLGAVPTTPEAVQQESQQLLDSVPVAS